MKSDRGFKDFLSSGKLNSRIVIIVVLGLLLILIGTGGSIIKKDSSSSEEEKAAKMCALMDGVGECRVMMTYSPDDNDRVYAVLVLCEGAEKIEVREKITSLFCSLYGIGAHRVEVQRLK